eukprot:Gregarina_sp_Poly_1__9341@NODE_580_length_7449_cov_96_149688_g63_i1_p1_GENE_NODE_580_length_7449_cov_96_149688_g63_i1NODE_580_length_7449_cov_96_149688_g63_i1_p1_ORF_typecomplete_len1740_score241_23Pkinase/PF00069_25/0_00024Pkinase/PF00069_25/9_6e22Pkinase/PF00069_25/6_6e16Pkinase_Tyr/PF07714_17/1_5e18Pkinase_Tyr/PF07714_17/6_1e13EFhand_1/PF00036_32/5_6e06EFhand_1/PF00036_32/1e05EFhand_1/PF00036_32/2_2EFhand_7/PF13499_6/0_0019EFhand_7/PF13499_6/1_1e09EFhand_7/PF13499_6/0_00066EFhand_7/PF13499_6/
MVLFNIVQPSIEKCFTEETSGRKATFDDGGSTYVGSSSAPNFDLNVLTERETAINAKHGSIRNSQDGIDPKPDLSPDNGSFVHATLPVVQDQSCRYVSRSSMSFLESRRSRALTETRGCLEEDEEVSPSTQGALEAEATTRQSLSPFRGQRKPRRNFLNPPSPRFHSTVRWRRFQHRQFLATSPATGCLDRQDSSDAQVSPSPSVGNKDATILIRLDELGNTNCPKCHSPSLFIQAPQIAGAIGALVYRGKTDKHVYLGELWLNSHTDTPNTEVIGDSTEGFTDPLERTHRERKRWQQLLKTMFDHLAARGHTDATQPHSSLKMWRTAQLDRESFLQVFPQLPGVVGERLFAAFDVNKNGVIDFEEFSNGLAILSSANLNHKLRFIFNMYDLNGDGQLSRDEMSMMLYHIPSSFSFLSNGRSRNLERDAGGGSFRRKSSSTLSSCRSSTFIKMFRTSRVLGSRHNSLLISRESQSQSHSDPESLGLAPGMSGDAVSGVPSRACNQLPSPTVRPPSPPSGVPPLPAMKLGRMAQAISQPSKRLADSNMLSPRLGKETPAVSSPTGNGRPRPSSMSPRGLVQQGLPAVGRPPGNLPRGVFPQTVSPSAVSPRSYTHREALLSMSPRTPESPRRFSLGSPRRQNRPEGDGGPQRPGTVPVPTKRPSIDVEIMSRLLHTEKATEATVKEFEIVVDKLVDRAFQIYDVDSDGAPPRRVDLMTFETFCQAVMRFQELKLALEVFCQETIQPQSFMPVPPDVLASRTVSKIPRSFAAKKTKSNNPEASTTQSRNPFQISIQQSDRSCISDIDDQQTKRIGSDEYRRHDGFDPLDGLDGHSVFAVDCSNCGASFMCRIRDDYDFDTTEISFRGKGKKSPRMKEVWEPPTPTWTDPKFPQSAPLPPCIRAHGDHVDFYGWLEKDGRKTGLSVRRFYLLRDRFLYYYRTVNDLTPLHAMLVTGCHCEKMIDDSHLAADSFVADGRRSSWPKMDFEPPRKFACRFGFEIRPHYRGGRRSFLYARTPAERDAWMKYINKASGVTGAGFHDVYMLQEPLGRGKFATVYRAMNRATLERVAVKILRKPDISGTDHTGGGLAGIHVAKRFWFPMGRWVRRRRAYPAQHHDVSEEENEASIREFQRTEVAVLRLLYHPNLIRLLDMFNTNQYLYLVMEWGPSGDLRRTIDIVKQINQCLARKQGLDTPESCPRSYGVTPGLTELWIPEWVVREIITGVLQGLSYLHSPKRNVIHRDLKPDNVLIKILISQLKFTMKQCVSGLPSVSSNTFEIIPPQDGRMKPRSKTIPVAVNFSGDRWTEIVPEFPHDGRIGKLRHSPLSLGFNEEGASATESLDTVDFYPNVDDRNPETAYSPHLPSPANIGLVREQLRLAGLKHTDTIQGGRTPQGKSTKTRQTEGGRKDSIAPEDGIANRHPELTRGRTADDAISPPRFPTDSDKPLTGNPDIIQSIPLRKSLLDSRSPRDSTLMVRLGTMNMRRDSEACERVAAETLNFWIFLHCLEWFDTPNIKERRRRRSLTLPVGYFGSSEEMDDRLAREQTGLDRNIHGDDNIENTLIPPFLRSKESAEVLQAALETLKSTQTVQSMNALFSSSFVKDAIVPKITDFGLSKIVAPPSNQDIADTTGLATYAEEALGTAAYAAPEVLAGRRYTTSADLWSLGVVTYQLLSGGSFPVFREVTSSRWAESAHDSSKDPVSSLLNLSKRVSKPHRKNSVRLVLLFQPEHAWKRVGPLGKVK